MLFLGILEGIGEGKGGLDTDKGDDKSAMMAMRSV